jgi:acetylornithine deacetylase
MVTGKIEERVCLEIQKMEGEMIQDLQRLVRIPSVVGQEAAIQEEMEKLYRSLGLDVVRLDPDIDRVREHPAFIDTGMVYKDRPNIIGILSGDPESRSLILNGHADVVSPDPVDAWEHDPWGAQIEGERMYGRGTGDMKAGLVANFFCTKGLCEHGSQTEGNGDAAERHRRGSGRSWRHPLVPGKWLLICTEPHDLNITISHAGVNYFRVKVQGKSMHAGLAHLGVNAIGKMYLIYWALEEAGSEKRERGPIPPVREGLRQVVPYPYQYGHHEGRRLAVQGGGRCSDGMQDKLRPWGEDGRDKGDGGDRGVPCSAWGPMVADAPAGCGMVWVACGAMVPGSGYPFVQTLKGAAEKVLGREVEFMGRAAGIDSRFSQYFHMAAACTGPRAGNIHGIDEYVEIPSITRVAQILAVTVLRWCGYEE